MVFLKLCIIHDPPLDGSVSGLCRERFLGTLSELSTIHQLPEGIVIDFTNLR